MTVSSTTTKVSYSGNGSLTVFAYTFKVFDQADLKVIVRTDATGTETVKTITTDYTVSGVGNTSGGNVTFVTAPASGETVVIRREASLTQTTDYTPNDPFPASSHEDALDKLTFFAQQQQEELDRAIKLSRTNTITSTEFTVGATDRANKILAFDGNGEISVTQELGTFQGNWSASTTYAARDIVKDTSTNNIFIANTAHTSSGSQPLTTNTDSAKWDLLVDAASATTSATNAATSATAAATSATNAATSATSASTAQTAAETAQAASETAKTASETAQAAAETAKTAAETALDTFDDIFLGAKTSDPTLDNDGDALQDGALYFDTTNNVFKVYDLGGTQWLTTVPSSAEQTNINTVAGISANVTTVAGISANVTTVAGISSDVTTVAADGTDIGTVAGISSNVTTVAGVSSDVTTVAAQISPTNNISTVAGISSNVTTVAGISANVTTVAGVSSDVTTVAGVSSNVTTVATDITNVNTVATNISDVNTFANQYRIAASAPTTSLDEGDLYFDTTQNQMFVYTGSAWVAVSPDLVADTTPQLGGNLDTNGNDINFGDNDKATFGASSDLEIYHDGGDSFINDVGTGNFRLKTNGLALQIRDSGDLDLANFNNNGSVYLKHVDAGVSTTRLQTTSSGIDVTGTVTADGLTVDTNTLYVDSTNNRVGIGTSSPSTNLDVTGTSRYTFNVGNAYTLQTSLNAAGSSFADDYKNATQHIWQTSGTERMRLDSSGRVGIGTSSPSSFDQVGGDKLVVGSGSGEQGITLYSGTANNGIIAFADGTTTTEQYRGYIQYNHPNDSLQIATASTEAMRVDSSGNVLVGKTAPNIGTAGAEIKPNGNLTSTANGDWAALFNRLTSDGDIAQFRKDGSTVGSIGAWSSSLLIGTGDVGLAFVDGTPERIQPRKADDQTSSDGLIDLGHTSSRFDDIYATNGTIQTSDANEKQQIASLTDSEIAAAKAISQLFKTFKWNDKVAAKGDAARTHTGVIAQDVEAAMTAAGLNAGDYAFFISTDWYVDADGNEVEADAEGAIAKNRKGIRYPELLSFVGAATEQRLANIETRLTALEAN